MPFPRTPSITSPARDSGRVPRFARPSGSRCFAESIRQALNECDWLVVILSPEALASAWVKQETDRAMADRRDDNKVIPILAERCAWMTLAMTASRRT